MAESTNPFLPYPQRLRHNNQNLPIIYEEDVLGGRRRVQNLSELYSLTDKIAKLEEHVTIVRVIDLAKDYLLIDINNVGNSTGWQVYDTGSVEVDQTVIENSTNPVSGGAVFSELDTKLDKADYNEYFKGKYTSLAALQTAWPTASIGDYAQVDEGAGNLVKTYNWDEHDGWVIGGYGSGATNTDELPEGVTNLYFTTARVQSFGDTRYALKSEIPTNYVTTDSSQTNLSGVKTWIDRHNFNAGLHLPELQTLSAVAGSYNLVLRGDSIVMSGPSNTFTISYENSRILFKANGSGFTSLEAQAVSSGTNIVKLPASAGTLALEGQIPTNFVTTNTEQTGLSGSKTWLNTHVFNSGISLPNNTRVSGAFAGVGSAYMYLQGDKLYFNDGGNYFITEVTSQGVYFGLAQTGFKTRLAGNTLTANNTVYLPTGTGTLALETDLTAKEDIANKATSLSSPNNTKYPTTQAVSTALNAYALLSGTNLFTGVNNRFHWGLAISGNTSTGIDFYDRNNNYGIVLFRPVTNNSSIDNYTLAIKPQGSTFYGALQVPEMTSNKTWNFPNASGTLALTTDIPSPVDISGKANLNGGNNFTDNQIITNGYIQVTSDEGIVYIRPGSISIGNNEGIPAQLVLGNTTIVDNIATGTIEIGMPSSSGVLALLSDISGKANLAGGNIFTNGNQTINNGRLLINVSSITTSTGYVDIVTPDSTVNNTTPAFRLKGGTGRSVTGSGFASGGIGSRIDIFSGNGGGATGPDNNFGGAGGQIYILAGDGGIAAGGSGINTAGNGGAAILQGGTSQGNGFGGSAQLKAGNSVAGFGGHVLIVAGYGSGGNTDAATSGAVVLNVSEANVIRGNTLIGILPDNDDRTTRLQVGGSGKFTGNVTATTFIGNLQGNATNADRWGNQLWAEINNPSFSSIITNNGSGWGYSSVEQVKSTLGLPTSGGYDLQSVTTRGSIITNPITIYSATSAAIRFANAAQTNILYLGTDESAYGVANLDAVAYVYGTGNFYISTGSLRQFTVSGTTGNVGIGTTSPNFKLQVAGQIALNNRMYFNPSTQTNQLIGDGTMVDLGGAENLGIRNDSGKIFFAAGSSTASMLIDGSNVGIGKSPNGYMLDVGGSIRADNYIDAGPAKALRLYDGTTFTGGLGSSDWAGGAPNRMVLYAGGGYDLGFVVQGSHVGGWTSAGLTITNAFSAGGSILGYKTGDSNVSWDQSQFEARSSTNPGIAFHIPSQYAAALWMSNSGILTWAGAGFSATGAIFGQRIVAGYDSGVAGSVNITDYLRVSGNGGLWWASHGVGIEANSDLGPMLYGQGGSIRIRLSTDGGVFRGAVAADNAYSIGFINQNNSWVFRVNDGAYISAYKPLTGGWAKSLQLDAPYPVIVMNSNHGGSDNYGGIGYDKGSFHWYGSSPTDDVPTMGTHIMSLTNTGLALNGSRTVSALGFVTNGDWYRTNGAQGWYNETYGGGIYMSDTTYVRVYANKAFLVNNTIQGDQFIAVSHEGYGVNDYGIGLVGVYASDRYQSVFSMGPAYKMAQNGTSLANHYGIAWTHENVGGQSKGVGHQMLITEGGTTQTAIGKGIWTIGHVTIGQSTGDGRGINLYNDNTPASTMPSYGIAFATLANYGSHGTVTQDWATYFNMVGGTGRGWIFRADGANRASIDGAGNAHFNGHITSQGFIYNTASGLGLGNKETGSVFYSDSAAGYTVKSSLTSTVEMKFRYYDGTLRGYVYGDASGFGFLNTGGNWAVRINDSPTGGGTLYNNWQVTGYLTATGGAGTSDIRFKNLEKFDFDLSILDNLDIHQYTWKEEKIGFHEYGRKHWGYIAQEVEKINPFLIMGTSEHKTLNKEELLILEVARLKQRVSDLEAQIK